MLHHCKKNKKTIEIFSIAVCLARSLICLKVTEMCVTMTTELGYCLSTDSQSGKQCTIFIQRYLPAIIPGNDVSNISGTWHKYLQYKHLRLPIYMYSVAYD